MGDRVGVVTGAAGGIGLAVSRALLAQGIVTVGADVDEKQLRSAATALGDGFVPFPVDLTEPERVTALFAFVADRFAGLDVLVNVAGGCFMTDFLEISPDELRRQMAVNFDSAFYCCQKAIPLMRKRPGVKKIVNISSNGAYNFEVFDPTHYRASKAALDNMTKDLTRRYAREGITVNSIAPAMTRTELFRVVRPEALEKALAEMPRGKPLEADEVAAWVAFLASPAGDCASGNVIILNQGRDVR